VIKVVRPSEINTPKSRGRAGRAGRARRGGRGGGWGLRLVAVAGCGAAGRSVGSGSAALGSLAGLPRFSGHADVHPWRGGRGGRLRMAALAGGRAVVRVLGSASLRAGCGPSPGALRGRVCLRRNVSEQDVAPVTPTRHLRTANARVCTSRMPCALTAILLPESRAHGCHMLQTWFPEWTRLGVHVARGRERRRRRRS